MWFPSLQKLESHWEERGLTPKNHTCGNPVETHMTHMCSQELCFFFFFFFKWRHRTCLEVRLMRNCGLTWEMRSLLTMSTQPCTREGLLVSSSARWCLYDLRWKLAPKTKPHFSYLFTCSVYRWHFNKIF